MRSGSNMGGDSATEDNLKLVADKIVVVTIC